MSVSVCDAPLDDWVNGGSVDVFFAYDTVLGLWVFKDKIMLHCFRKMKC